MQDAVYATYLGTLVTLAAAIRRSNRAFARQVIADALCLGGRERFALLIAIDDASVGLRRSKEDLLREIGARMLSAEHAVAA